MARGTGQAQAVGHLVQVVAQGHLAVVHGVDDALARAAQQGGAGNAGQVVGVDVVGDHVVSRHQGRYLLAQSLHRQAVGGVDAGHAQHEGRQGRLLQATVARSRDVSTVLGGAVWACAVGVGAISATAARVGSVRAMEAEAHLPLGVHPAAGAVGQRLQRVGLAGEGTAPVAVDAGGGQVDKARGRGVPAPAWGLGGGGGHGKQCSCRPGAQAVGAARAGSRAGALATRPGQCLQPAPCQPVGHFAVAAGGWGGVQDVSGPAGQAVRVIGLHGHGALRADLLQGLVAACHAHDLPAVVQLLHHALADVAAADDQQSLTAETPGNWAIMRGLAFLLDHAPILTGELT